MFSNNTNLTTSNQTENYTADQTGFYIGLAIFCTIVGLAVCFGCYHSCRLRASERSAVHPMSIERETRF